MDLLADGLAVRIRHHAECPEVDPILCATEDIPEHLHDQHIAWFRLDPTLSAGLGRGWQLSAQVPVDLRVVRVDYETLDGEPYDPPYDDIHHRDETITGPVDATVLVRKLVRTDHWVLGGAIGSTLPIGRTEEDPFLLTEQGLAHEHLQLGTGTFVPVVAADVAMGRRRWGGLAWVQGRLPVYESTKGYLPPLTVSVGGGPTLRVIPPLQLTLGVEALYEGAERWHEDPHGGRVAGMAGLGALYDLAPRWVLQAQARATVAQWSAENDEDATYVQPFIGTLGVSWTFGAKK